MIERIGVVGAGQMGHGIAHVAALAGCEVRMADVSEDRLRDALEKIGHNLDRQLRRGVIDEYTKAKTVDQIRITTNFADFGDCDLVIEAATEKEAVKRDIFKSLIPHLRDDDLLATNTSSISIIATDDATFEEVRELSLRMGKHPVAAEDFPAFIVNRILLPMVNEAVYTLYEGVGSVDSIDQAMKLGANHPMGPLELADFIGLDVCLSVMQVLYEGLADSKYRPCPLLVKYVEAGWLGRKTNRGFYDYNGPDPIPTR